MKTINGNLALDTTPRPDFDDVVFITYVRTGAYVGREEFTPTMHSLMEAMLVSNQLSTK